MDNKKVGANNPNIEIINKSKDPVMQFGDFYDDFVEEGAAFFLTQVLFIIKT